MTVIWKESTASTNDDVKRLSPGLDNLTVIASEGQTSGRGQGDHSWFSTPGLNLTFSLLWRPGHMAGNEILDITRVITLGLTDYLLSKGVRAGIKWPNDIWVDGRKICGILIENTISEGFVSDSVIGVGLNLNETDFPSDLPNPVSLRQLTGEKYDTKLELERLCSYFESRISMLDTLEGHSVLERDFSSLIFTK